MEVVHVSPMYETARLGPAGAVLADEPAYLNGAVVIETRLSAQALREETSRIEHAMGRREHGRWESRVVDIDLVLNGEQRIATAELTVPHAYRGRNACCMQLWRRCEPKSAPPAVPLSSNH
jgi:2-amino-4-hydroxy-6-hydroxymethyldihydropteridine diphosphokinase